MFDWTTPGAPSADHVLVRLPGPGVHRVTVRVADRVGNRGESAPVEIRVPTRAEADDARVEAPPTPRVGGGARVDPGMRWAYAQARRFHAGRGARLVARLRIAPTSAEWRRMLGPAAGRYRGYATLRGEVLLGPGAVRGLRMLVAARRAGGGRPSRADLDQAAAGLAVLLHETMHATGPAARRDALGTRSGRAFEEGFTESATIDLLPRFARALDIPAPLRSRLAAAVARRRPAYAVEVAWARRMSARATRVAAGSARAGAWRIRVADTWGTDRWARLATATGRDEETLRADAAGRGGRRVRAGG